MTTDSAAAGPCPSRYLRLIFASAVNVDLLDKLAARKVFPAPRVILACQFRALGTTSDASWTNLLVPHVPECSTDAITIRLSVLLPENDPMVAWLEGALSVTWARHGFAAADYRDIPDGEWTPIFPAQVSELLPLGDVHLAAPQLDIRGAWRTSSDRAVRRAPAQPCPTDHPES